MIRVAQGEAMMEGPKRIYRMGQCWCEKPTHEDNKGYVPADLADALAEAAEEVIKSATGAYNEKRTNVSKDKFKKLKDALAAYRDERHSMHTIFKFDDLDDDVCGKHQCGYTTDGCIFIETSILPGNWKIREAPKQLSIDKFTKPISALKNLVPLDLPPSDVALLPWVIRYVGSDVVLNNKYVLLLEHLGCTMRYQKRERTGKWITSALSIEKDGRIVGLLMPMLAVD